MVKVRSRLVGVAAVLAVAAIVLAGGTPGAAQDATPTAGMAMAPIPNHIHAGTCANLGEVVWTLASAEFPTGMMGGGMQGSPTADMASPMASPMAGMATPMAGMMGAASAIPVAVATTQVELALSDILAAEHSINFHDPADPGDPSRYLACGDIGGTPTDQGNLFIGLAEQNNSGYHGVAWLLDDGSGTGTTVTVFLAYGGMMGGDMGMEATPSM